MDKSGRMLLFFAMILALTPICGCDESGSGGGGDTDPEDLEDPAITLDNLELYQGIVGQYDVDLTASDDVGVAKVELLVDGEVVATSTEAPFTISWDSTGAPDGIVTVTAVATDAAGKTAQADGVDVVVVNAGEIVELDEGAEGTLVVPTDWTAATETDVKHHWTSTVDGYSRVLSIILFEPDSEQEDWAITCDVGTGFCPHSGQSLDQSETVTESPLVFDSTPDGGFPGETLLFVHLGFNPQDHIGEELDFTMLVFAFF